MHNPRNVSDSLKRGKPGQKTRAPSCGAEGDEPCRLIVGGVDELVIRPDSRVCLSRTFRRAGRSTWLQDRKANLQIQSPAAPSHPRSVEAEVDRARL